VAVPPSLYFALHTDSSRPAATAPSTSPRPAATNTPGARRSGTTAPATPVNRAPDGRIAPAALKNMTLRIPAWPTDNLPGLSGDVKFSNGHVTIPPDPAYPTGRQMAIGRIAYADVDRDGAQETVAVIGTYLQSGSEQLVAFDRDSAGRVVTLGAVTATTGEVRAIDQSSFSISPNGEVRVRVADYAGCCGDPTPTQWQWRTYRWVDGRFYRVGEPVSFPNNPSVTETGATTGDLALGPAIDGVRHGTLTVTVAYLYGTVPDHLSIRFYPADLQRDGTAWPPTYAVTNGYAVDVPTPAIGTTATYTFAFSQSANSTGKDLRLQVGGSNKQDTALLSESNPYNSFLNINIRTVG
jgi:hypothetical protein